MRVAIDETCAFRATWLNAADLTTHDFIELARSRHYTFMSWRHTLSKTWHGCRGARPLTLLAAFLHHGRCFRLFDARNFVAFLDQRVRVATVRNFREATVGVVALETRKMKLGWPKHQMSGVYCLWVNVLSCRADPVPWHQSSRLCGTTRKTFPST